MTLDPLLAALPTETVTRIARPDILLHLLAALVAGGAIGIERSYHGRPAGFRTHALVCLASSLLMMLTVYQAEWFHVTDEARADPTRMAQGIMTGIGFLGAGVIFKEGITVRGLTTAASIWTTAAIGVLMGSGLWQPAIAGTLIALGVLSGFRWIEARIPSHRYAHHRLRFARGEVLPEAEVRALLERHGCSPANLSWHVVDEGRFFEYRMTLRTGHERNFSALARSLGALAPVIEFRISPAGD